MFKNYFILGLIDPSTQKEKYKRPASMRMCEGVEDLQEAIDYAVQRLGKYDPEVISRQKALDESDLSLEAYSKEEEAIDNLIQVRGMGELQKNWVIFDLDTLKQVPFNQITRLKKEKELAAARVKYEAAHAEVLRLEQELND